MEVPDDIRLYVAANQKAPFSEWMQKLEVKMQAIIDVRIARIRGGNFGDVKHLCGSLFEVRIDFGPGYRIYYGMYKKTVVILLCGGEKRSQERDIAKAKEYWEDFLSNVGKRK